MAEKPYLTIVTCTRGNFTDYWLEQLCNIKGNAEFLLVYPPDVRVRDFADKRVRVIICPLKGEVIQRLTGLLNAQGRYVLALDDDDYLHPDFVFACEQYFSRFPDSWVFRPRIGYAGIDNVNYRLPEWEKMPDVNNLKVYSSKERPRDKETQGLLEVPIAPLTNRVDLRCVFNPFNKRKDQFGPHMDNFNNRAWQTDIVQNSLTYYSRQMNIAGALKWVPSFSLDRPASLFIQALNYRKGVILGHWLMQGEQVQRSASSARAQEARYYLPAELLLVKAFPRYGYFWNMFFEQAWCSARIFAKRIAQGVWRRAHRA
jgi:glycosyltransferase involved in cell wall biosynthesis